MFDRSTQSLVSDVEDNAIFQKNLEILRGMKKSKIDYLEGACRTALRNKQSFYWISEVTLPEADSLLTSNLINKDTIRIHRLLVSVDLPATRLSFGAERSEESEEKPSITRVDTFTISNIIDYFAKVFSITRNKEREKSWAGSFDYLLKCYSLDVILFAIDFAKMEEDIVLSPLEINKDRFNEAEEYVMTMGGRKEICPTQVD